MILNILRNFFKKSNYLVIIKKLLKRFEKDNHESSIKWAKKQTNQTIDELMQKIDFKLYLKSKKECKILRNDAEKILSNINENLSGGAAFELLYFLTKKRKPKIIVETGVAAGWSTLAFLRASKYNKNVEIFSSDFPLFRNNNPVKNIGILTKNETNLKKLNLFIEGDEKNLALISKKLKNKKIDLFHYDSDKSYSGRNFSLKILKQYFSDSVIIIFDDINNNLHFKDFVKNNNLKYNVVKHKRGFIGIVDFNLQIQPEKLILNRFSQ